MIACALSSTGKHARERQHHAAKQENTENLENLENLDVWDFRFFFYFFFFTAIVGPASGFKGFLDPAGIDSDQIWA